MDSIYHLDCKSHSGCHPCLYSHSYKQTLRRNRSEQAYLSRELSETIAVDLCLLHRLHITWMWLDRHRNTEKFLQTTKNISIGTFNHNQSDPYSNIAAQWTKHHCYNSRVHWWLNQWRIQGNIRTPPILECTEQYLRIHEYHLHTRRCIRLIEEKSCGVHRKSICNIECCGTNSATCTNVRNNGIGSRNTIRKWSPWAIRITCHIRTATYVSVTTHTTQHYIGPIENKSWLIRLLHQFCLISTLYASCSWE